MPSLERHVLASRRHGAVRGPRAPRVGQVGEAPPEVVGVRADERVLAGQVDVVADHHERARARTTDRGRPRRSSGPRPRPEPLEQQHRLDDEARVVALVEVEAALEHDDRPTAERAQQQPAGVAGRGGGGPARRSAKGIATASSRSSASPPSPEPRTIPISGTSGANCADRRLQHRQACRLTGRRDRAGRVQALAGVGGERTIGHAGLQDRIQGVDGRGPAASSARRKYRHRDADHVPSGRPAGSRRETPTRPGKEAPEATGAERRP